VQTFAAAKVQKIFDICKFWEDFYKNKEKMRAYLRMSKKSSTFAASLAQTGLEPEQDISQ
jgi:hypothetical protein